MKNEGEYLKSHYRHVSKLEHVARFVFGSVCAVGLGIAASGALLYKAGVITIERPR